MLRQIERKEQLTSAISPGRILSQAEKHQSNVELPGVLQSTPNRYLYISLAPGKSPLSQMEVKPTRKATFISIIQMYVPVFARKPPGPCFSSTNPSMSEYSPCSFSHSPAVAGPSP
jgi:hypothetical protein